MKILVRETVVDERCQRNDRQRPDYFFEFDDACAFIQTDDHEKGDQAKVKIVLRYVKWRYSADCLCTKRSGTKENNQAVHQPGN